MNSYIHSALKEFKRYRTLGQKTIERVPDEVLFHRPNQEVNSIAMMVKHLHGNMMSRWTNFMTEDGEKSWRERDGEFEDTVKSRAEIDKLWTEGWDLVFHTLENLKNSNPEQKVIIRGEEHTVIEAINRQLCHYAYHVGQMVLIGKTHLDSRWESLSIPKGESKRFNEEMKGKNKR